MQWYVILICNVLPIRHVYDHSRQGIIKLYPQHQVMRNISLHGWMQIIFHTNCQTLETIPKMSVSFWYLGTIHPYTENAEQVQAFKNVKLQNHLDSEILAKANTLPQLSKLGDLITLASIISSTLCSNEVKAHLNS